MQTVEAMIKAPDHREKMPHIIKTILEFAYLTYSGMEPLKKKSFLNKYKCRFAKRTYQRELDEKIGCKGEKSQDQNQS